MIPFQTFQRVISAASVIAIGAVLLLLLLLPPLFMPFLVVVNAMVKEDLAVDSPSFGHMLCKSHLCF